MVCFWYFTLLGYLSFFDEYEPTNAMKKCEKKKFYMVPTDLEKCLKLNAVLKSAWFFNLPWKWEIFIEKCLKMTLWSWKI